MSESVSPAPLGNWGWNSHIDDPANLTSHRRIHNAGTRLDRNGNPFTAWHSPSVVTEQVPVSSFVEFGLEQSFITRKVRTVVPQTLTIERGPKRDRRVKTGSVGQFDEPIIADGDEEANESNASDADADAPRPRRTTHEIYLKESRRREQKLSAMYEGYKKGFVSAHRLVDFVASYIKKKAATQANLGSLRRDENHKVKNTIDDHAQDFLFKVWANDIEPRKVTGPLAHWLNSAFEKHFATAQKKNKRERWRWQRFIDENEGTAPEETAESGDEPITVRSLTTPAPPALESAPASPTVALFTGTASLRTIEKAKREFLRRHPRGDKRNIFHFMAQGHTQKQTAILLHLSESKVSRVWAQVEREIRELAREIALERAVERRRNGGDGE